MTRTLLVRNATVIATLDGARREIADGAVFARDGVIEAVGPTSELRPAPTRSSTPAGRSCCPAWSTRTTT